MGVIKAGWKGPQRDWHGLERCYKCGLKGPERGQGKLGRRFLKARLIGEQSPIKLLRIENPSGARILLTLTSSGLSSLVARKCL